MKRHLFQTGTTFRLVRQDFSQVSTTKRTLGSPFVRSCLRPDRSRPISHRTIANTAGPPGDGSRMSQLFKKGKLWSTGSASDYSQDSSEGRDRQGNEDSMDRFRWKTRGKVEKEAKQSKVWVEQKEKFLAMPVEEKRQYYKTKKLVMLDQVDTWPQYFAQCKEKLLKLEKKTKCKRPTTKFDVNDTVNSQVSVWRGDITALEIDAITNAANNSLLGGGGVDGAIHSAAGKLLVQECETLHGCETGNSKITGAYKLPAKYVIHTVGPIGQGEADLRNCYETSLALALKHELRSIAFPCISTGIYGFPNERAAHIALSTARKFLEDNPGKMDRIIFCLFLPIDVEIYGFLMQQYFPLSSEPDTPSNDDNGALESTADSAIGHTNGAPDENEPAKGSKSSDKEQAKSPKLSEKAQAKSPKSSEKAQAKSPKSSEKAQAKSPKSSKKAQAKSSKSSDKEQAKSPKSSEGEQAKSPKSSEEEQAKSPKSSEESTMLETESASSESGKASEQPERSEMELASQSDGTESDAMDTGKPDNMETEGTPTVNVASAQPTAPSSTKQKNPSPAKVHKPQSTCKM